MSKFIINQTKTGFTFALKASNGETICTGGEVYVSLTNCKNGINSVINNAPVAAFEDQTVEDFATEKNPKFELYVDKSGEYRFRLKAKNGEPIAASEGYKAKASCKNGIESVRKNVVDAEIVEPEKQ